MPATTRSDTDYLLTAFTAETADVLHAIAVSSDGLLIAQSAGLHRDQADHLAAVAAGLSSLTQNLGAFIGSGSVRQHIIETDSGLVILMSLGTLGELLAIAGPSADMGKLGYAMGLLVDRVGAVLDPDRR